MSVSWRTFLEIHFPHKMSIKFIPETNEAMNPIKSWSDEQFGERYYFGMRQSTYICNWALYYPFIYFRHEADLIAFRMKWQ